MEPHLENRERFANATTHGLGLALSVAGAIVLISYSILHGSFWHIVACSVYAASLVLLYLSSTLYHTFTAQPHRRLFRILDHSAIYFLIAGTYTPFTMVSLRGRWGWTLLGVLWGLALCGVALKFVVIGRFPAVSIAVYILMGWMGIISVKPLLAAISLRGFLWVVAGGIFYTGGVLFYRAKTMPYSHAIWHLFVMGGSACHYFAVVFYVLPHPSS
ncbi:MAG TPA: hemolysin III family protein [Terriglobia bacterium]|nr:hemolysin III family protein [Terriglobia bacterium]